FVPQLVAAAIIFAGGLVVSLIARRVVQRLLVSLRFDRPSLPTRAREMLRKAEMPTADVLVGQMVFWIVWIGFIVSAVDTLQLRPFQGLHEQFLPFSPRIFAE